MSVAVAILAQKRAPAELRGDAGANAFAGRGKGRSSTEGAAEPLAVGAARGCRSGTLAFDFKCPDRGKGKGNFEVPFSRFPELFRARSRLYRSQILQVNTRWKALVEIYTMHSFAPFSNLKFFVKNR